MENNNERCNGCTNICYPNTYPCTECSLSGWWKSFFNPPNLYKLCDCSPDAENGPVCQHGKRMPLADADRRAEVTP